MSSQYCPHCQRYIGIQREDDEGGCLGPLVLLVAVMALMWAMLERVESIEARITKLEHTEKVR